MKDIAKDELKNALKLLEDIQKAMNKQAEVDALKQKQNEKNAVDKNKATNDKSFSSRLNSCLAKLERKASNLLRTKDLVNPLEIKAFFICVKHLDVFVKGIHDNTKSMLPLIMLEKELETLNTTKETDLNKSSSKPNFTSLVNKDKVTDISPETMRDKQEKADKAIKPESIKERQALEETTPKGFGRTK